MEAALSSKASSKAGPGCFLEPPALCTPALMVANPTYIHGGCCLDTGTETLMPAKGHAADGSECILQNEDPQIRVLPSVPLGYKC